MSMMVWNTALVSLNDCKLPPQCKVGRISPHEIRVVDTSSAVHHEKIMNRDTGAVVDAIPDDVDLAEQVQITFHLDSGSTNRGAYFFGTNSLGLMLFAVWGRIHRCVRDVRLSIQHSCNGDIERAVLAMTHVWSIHSKPFGSGQWFLVLGASHKHYISVHSSRSASFRVYGELWVIDLRAAGERVPLDTDGDWDDLWSRFCELFTTKLSGVKQLRWFSTNEAFKDNGISFFWPLKLVLRHHFGRRPDEDPETFQNPVAITKTSPAKELAALKANNNGLRVAERVLNPWTHFHIRVYAYGSKATWTWYTNCRKRVKSALEGVRYVIMHSGGAYVDEIKDMIRDCLSTPSHLLDMGITSNISAGVDVDNQRRRSTVISEFLWTLSGNRIFGKCHLAFKRSIIMEAY